MTEQSKTETQEQIEVAKRLQKKLLERYEKLLDDGTLGATDAANLQRLLSQNGWVLDETRIPSRLKDKLTATYDPTVVDADDKVVPIRARA